MALINKNRENLRPKIDISGPNGNAMAIRVYLSNFIGKEEAQNQVMNSPYLDSVSVLFFHAMDGIDIIHELGEEELETVLNKVEMLRAEEANKNKQAKDVRECIKCINSLDHMQLNIM